MEWCDSGYISGRKDKVGTKHMAVGYIIILWVGWDSGKGRRVEWANDIENDEEDGKESGYGGLR